MPHSVTVQKANTQLPNGFYYQVGTTVILSNEQFSKLLPKTLTDGTLTDNGNVP